MKHYDFPKTFRALYDKAVALYAKGQRGAETFFTTEEQTFLTLNGITAQHLYDYAEDHNNYSAEPGPDLALGIESIRRDYFLNMQGGVASGKTLDVASLPPKDASVQGIGWLPRIIPKTKAKLRGELPASLMYGCGGDRKFFKANDINPVEFLSLIWRNEDNDQAIIDWVVKRAAATAATAQT